MISGNISQSVRLDSVEVNFDNGCYYANTYFIQMLMRTTLVTERNLVTKYWFMDISPSDNNLHGFLMEKWQILENNEIKSYPR